MKKNIFLFTTKRLAVRRYNLEDAELLYEYSRQTSNRELPNEVLDSLDHAKTYVEMAIHSCKMGHLPIRYAIVLKETGDFIGALSYKATPNREVHLTIMIAEEYQGKGYASEIIGAAVENVKKLEGIGEVYAFVRNGNTAAVSIVEKAGFVLLEEYEADWFGNTCIFRRYKV